MYRSVLAGIVAFLASSAESVGDLRLLSLVFFWDAERVRRVGAVRNRLRFCKDLWARSGRPQVWQLPHARRRT